MRSTLIFAILLAAVAAQDYTGFWSDSTYGSIRNLTFCQRNGRLYGMGSEAVYYHGTYDASNGDALGVWYMVGAMGDAIVPTPAQAPYFHKAGGQFFAKLSGNALTGNWTYFDEESKGIAWAETRHATVTPSALQCGEPTLQTAFSKTIAGRWTRVTGSSEGAQEEHYCIANDGTYTGSYYYMNGNQRVNGTQRGHCYVLDGETTRTLCTGNWFEANAWGTEMTRMLDDDNYMSLWWTGYSEDIGNPSKHWTSATHSASPADTFTRDVTVTTDDPLCHDHDALYKDIYASPKPGAANALVSFSAIWLAIIVSVVIGLTRTA